MKPWMKVLFLLGLGGSFGFFTGYNLGNRQGRKDGYQQCREDAEDRWEAFKQDGDRQLENARKALKEYQGGDTDGDEDIPEMEDIVHDLDQDLPDYVFDNSGAGSTVDGDEEEEPPTAEEPEGPVVRQLHPQDLLPQPITEDEYNLNEWDYDLVDLIFYEMDEVLYEPEHEEIIQQPDEVLGIGALFRFGWTGDPNNPEDYIYVKNDTMGTLYRVQRVDAAFCDAVDGACGPNEDD